jgi:Stage II sporulation protein E (SpoIIE)
MHLRILFRASLFRLAIASLASLPIQLFAQPTHLNASAPILASPDIGREILTLDGPWQFHLGDDPAWAQSSIDDSTGHNGWEQITANSSWGAQGHPTYTGYAWYRRHLSLNAGNDQDLAILIPHIGDVYEIYWNGNFIARNCKFPPASEYFNLQGAQTFSLGQIQEVGGDFFQIYPLNSGGILIVVGDVSGKGMPAAMTVSLLVGTFRTLAHYTQSPTEIITAMNQRMLGRTNGGFTTCLVLRVDANGKVTIANAGHIAPYLDGHELATDNGLPLGLSEDSTYSESTCDLASNQQLTLITDGVLEARSRTGELFGLDRTAAISIQSAETIAQTAQAFGEDDDITVLTLTRQATA